MSDRIEWFTVTIPANTPIATPQRTSCVFQQGEVVQIDVIVPPGPSGNVGFFISAGGSQYVPRTPGSYIVADNIFIQWPITNAINSGSWAFTAYNTDLVSHKYQIGFHIDEVGPSLTTSGQVIGMSSASLALAMSQASALVGG